MQATTFGGMFKGSLKTMLRACSHTMRGLPPWTLHCFFFFFPEPSLASAHLAASLLVHTSHTRSCLHTFACLAVCLQLEGAVTVACGPTGCRDTVVLTAHSRTVGSELCTRQERHSVHLKTATTADTQPPQDSNPPPFPVTLQKLLK